MNRGKKYLSFAYVTLAVLFFSQINIVLAQPLSGTYTIGGSNPDFTTISDAINSLQSNGISSSVTFKIRSGTYETNNGSERALYISQSITGASESNIVTFQADESTGANAENTILQRKNGPNETGWVAYIRSSFITLNNLSFIYANDDTTLTGVNIYQDNLNFNPIVSSEGINNIEIRNCKITSNSTSKALRGITIGTGGNNIIIEDNLIEKCGDGLFIERCNGCIPFNNVSVINNKFRRLSTYQDVQVSQHGEAIHVSNGSNYDIKGNDIDYQYAHKGFYGITVIGSDARIEGNRIRNVAYQTYPYDTFIGIYLRAIGGSSIISNNMISNIRKRAYGIYLENSNNVNVFHNTVALEMVNASNLKLTALYLGSCNNITTKNNILATHYNSGSFNYNYVLESGGTNSNIVFDYNIIYSEPFKIIFNGTNYDSLSAWQQTGQDLNSKSFDPEFVDLTPFEDVHLGYCSLGNEQLWGTPLPDVILDFDGETRDQQNPYIGADEVDSYRPDVFSDIQLTAVEDEALYFTAGDIDNDGDNDIAVVNNYNWLGGSEDVSIFLNDGQGNFSGPSHIEMGVEPTILKIIDIDADGFNDLIATTNSVSGMPVIRWGQGGGAFAAPIEITAYPLASLGPVTDIGFYQLSNHVVQFFIFTHFGTVGVDSGWVDFCFFKLSDRSFYYYLSNGYFPTRAGKHPSSIITMDVDNDSISDFVVNDWITGKTTTFKYLGYTNGFTRMQEIAVDIGTNPIHANMDFGDVDMDNDNDIIIGAWANGTDSLALLRNDGDGNFTVESIQLDSRRPSQSFSVFDYENDGAPDIITATTMDDMILYHNDGFGNFDILRLCQNSNFGSEAGTILNSDFNGDGKQDVAVLAYDDEFGTMLNLDYVVGTDDDLPNYTSIPNNFVLEQNYPNPFNPTTIIQYSVPQRSDVILKVYDILGSEVATLVNEEKTGGVYSVNFDASQLSSGIYFYRIQAGSFVETKKMILLK